MSAARKVRMRKIGTPSDEIVRGAMYAAEAILEQHGNGKRDDMTEQEVEDVRSVYGWARGYAKMRKIGPWSVTP